MLKLFVFQIIGMDMYTNLQCLPHHQHEVVKSFREGLTLLLPEQFQMY